MDYIELSVNCQEAISEILIALFSLHDFDTFEETDHGFKAYIKKELWNANLQESLEGIKENFAYDYSLKEIPSQNWNQLWESNFQPIQVGSFCGIRADFHPPFEESVTHEIVINPKMAFGTGHHETTFMVIEMMERINFADKKVFDYGCGTGILAILAAKLGSTNIYAIDIDPASVENSLENFDCNNTSQIVVEEGVLTDVDSRDFEIILANINRNVILDSLSTLFQKLKAGGILIISGILKEDEEVLREEIKEVGFTISKIIEKNNWICLQLLK